MPELTAPIQILHFADVHFGVETYGRYDPSTGLNSRLIDFRTSLLSAINIALERGIEIALFAGDAYKTRDPSQTHQREFASCLSKLTSAGVPVVLLAGNHDIPNTKGRANAIEIYGALNADMVTVLDRRSVRIIRTKAGRELQIAAIPYLTKSVLLAREEMGKLGVQETIFVIAEQYEIAIENIADECRLNPHLPTVLMGHFTVATADVGKTQAGYLIGEPQVSKESLRRSEFDYVALGHIHKYQDLNKGRQPPIVYSGSIDRIDFGERSEEKGVVFAEITKGQASYEFVPVQTRPFLEIMVDTTSESRTETIDPTDRVLEALAKFDLTQAVVKLIYKVSPEDAPLLRERYIRQALHKSFMVVSQQREVAGSDKAASVRSKLLKESLDPLDALSTYIDSREHLSKRKADLMEKANELWQDLVKREGISSGNPEL